tara:strand:- start:9329 stop:9649 length:321 start_codon:yes stop_codon:yes gene_type:complete
VGKLVKSIEEKLHDKFLIDLGDAMTNSYMDPFDYLMKYEGYSLNDISKYSLNHASNIPKSSFGSNLAPEPRDEIISALAHSLLDGETDVDVMVNLEKKRDDMSEVW